MVVSKLLLETLNEMGKDDFETFRWYFYQENILDGCQHIPRGIIETADRKMLVTEMTNRYGDDLSVKLGISVLKQMGNNSVADKLRIKHEEGLKAASCSTTSPTATPAATVPLATAGPTVSAQGGSVVFSPIITHGSNVGTVNINLTTPQ
ncbi:pyrin-like [Cololabis saira]|uniref:pyrin-like n=1 Tax=Cololabis saira TaxID=129043 RepID=UPI002AD33801|nr:pyrin-like [Cololabis saira]XP_061587361.1 pyrin-like [Cololabis saira]